MIWLAIDPGPEQSGVVTYGSALIRGKVLPNESLLRMLYDHRWMEDKLVIEMIASYGMPVGASVFETCVWIGRFMQAWHKPEDVLRVPRSAVKLHLCHSARAKDANVWRALLDRFGPVGTKAAPGPLYGIKSHARAALALAVTAADLHP